MTPWLLIQIGTKQAHLISIFHSNFNNRIGLIFFHVFILMPHEARPPPHFFSNSGKRRLMGCHMNLCAETVQCHHALKLHISHIYTCRHIYFLSFYRINNSRMKFHMYNHVWDIWNLGGKIDFKWKVLIQNPIQIYLKRYEQQNQTKT